MMSGSFFMIRGGSVTLNVKAKPGARQDAVLGVRGAELVVAVRAVAEKGRANVEIARVIAKSLGVPRDSVVLKRGGASPHKVFEVPAEAAARLFKMESER
jgi:uncharacterized protein YggU (UPF0235/DUF167 family)